MVREIVLCRASEIPEGKSRKFVADGRDVLIYRLNGLIGAVESFCPHAYTDLASGRLNPRAGTIRCPNHGAVFDLRTGEALCGPFGVEGEILPKLTFFDVVEREGNVVLMGGS